MIKHNDIVVLGMDPSGNFKEGKGTTGYCVLVHGSPNILEVGAIRAHEFDSAAAYWQAHIELLHRMQQEFGSRLRISLEDYVMYAHKMEAQTWSNVETLQLIGVIRMWCYQNQIKLYMRPAAAVKKRWANHILEHKGYICSGPTGKGWQTAINGYPLMTHIMDSIRHAVHCSIFDIPKEENDV